MASDYWSRKSRAVSSCWVLFVIMLIFILSFLLPLVLADIRDDSLAARSDIPNYHSDNQIILQPEPSSDTPVVEQNELTFQLRHVFQYGSQENPSSYKVLDACPDSIVISSDESGTARQNPKLRVRSAKSQMERLVDRSHSSIHTLLDAGRAGGKAMPLPPSAWTVDEVTGPNVTDKETVLSFARMAADAYVDEPGETDWKKVGCGFNYTEDFGWQRDGLRGHIYADTENKTIVIGIKGTSAALFDGSETTTNDKENDNLFFSCCCGEGGQYLWRRVCSCKTSTYTCNSTCVATALKEKNRYYYSSIELYRNVTELYPDADIWLSGHSLGGSVASLLGLTFGLPVVTFEAPGEALAASRLGLPTPPGYNDTLHQKRHLTGGTHFGHTADPIFMGLCNSASSSCTVLGYALETVCHTGRECVFDTVEDLGWRVAVGTHSIENVIKDVIEKYDELPHCKPNPDCTDCFNWKYFESNGTESTTTVTTTTTTMTSHTDTYGTRTQTCKTPGWWGCLDESSTSTGTTTTSESTSTSTCKTPGWFGCKDPTTTTTTTSSSSSSTATTPVTVTVTATATATSSATSEPPTKPSSSAIASETMSTRTETASSEISTDPTSQTATKTSQAPEPTESHCVRRNWFGKCKEWETKNEALYLEPTFQSGHDDI